MSISRWDSNLTISGSSVLKHYTVFGEQNVYSNHKIQYFDWLLSESEYDNRTWNFYDRNACLQHREFLLDIKNTKIYDKWVSHLIKLLSYDRTFFRVYKDWKHIKKLNRHLY